MWNRRLVRYAGVFVSAFLFAPLLLPAQPYLDSTRIAKLLETQQYLFNDRFHEVDSIYQEQIRQYPADPAVYLFRAGGLLAEMTDREENLHEQLFISLLDTVRRLSDRILDTCDSRTAAWMCLFQGHAKAYGALWESKFGSSISALKLGLSSIDEYEQGLRHDSTLYDLYFGIGSYHYWKSAKAGLLRWLFIFKDEKDEGIEELRRAADASLLHRDLARSALIWVWLDCKQYDSAIALAENFARRFPDGKTFLWPIAQARMGQKQYAEAADAFARLRSFFVASPGNYYNLVECDYYLAQCYSWLGDRNGLREAASRLRTYQDSIPATTRARQSAKLNYLNKIAAR